MSNERQLSFEEINPDPDFKLEELQKKPSPITLLLDRIDDAKNLGAIFRLADAAGIRTIYGFQIKSTNSKKFEKVSRQTTSHIAFIHLEELNEVIKLTTEYKPICLEYTNKSIPYTEFKEQSPCMLIIGNERNGVSEDLLSISETSLHIPMLGKNSSMNVSVATGIVVYHLLENMNQV